MLNAIRHPAATDTGKPPLVIVHGLFGSARNWGALARRLAATRAVVVPDLRNHGESPWKASHTYPDLAADLAELVEDIGGPVDLLGHSMGGKASMMLALTRPDLLRRLVVADVAPVPYDHDQSQYIHAMRGLDLTGPLTRAEADRRLAANTPDPALRAFFLQSLDLKAPGGPRWRLNLDVLERDMPGIVGWPGVEGRFDGPALFLSGGESHYVRPEYRPAIRALFPAARFAKIPGAGHWLHADKPDEFARTVEIFLSA